MFYAAPAIKFAVDCAKKIDRSVALILCLFFYAVCPLFAWSIIIKKFGYNDTKRETNNFRTLIGQGGFGSVYKAQFNDGLILAVKRMESL